MKLNPDLHVSGIYKIQNKVNGKIYIGSSIDIYKRFNAHLAGLRGNTHHNKKLQRSWNKYGENAFEFSILDVVGSDELVLKEQYYLDLLEPEFNLILDVQRPLSIPRSQSHRDNHSRAMRLSAWVQSDEYSKSQSDKVKALWKDREYRNKMLLKFSSQETRKKHSDSTKNVWSNPEIVEKAKKSFKEGFKTKGRKNGIKNVEILKSVLYHYFDLGLSITDIAHKFGVGYNTVSRATKKYKNSSVTL